MLRFCNVKHFLHYVIRKLIFHHDEKSVLFLTSLFDQKSPIDTSRMTDALLYHIAKKEIHECAIIILYSNPQIVNF